jgi:hypothetical protein
MKIDLTDARVGDRHYFGKQRYQVIGLRPHTRKDGIETELVELATHCFDCDTAFTLSASKQSSCVNRRCQCCKRPGNWVRN